ncbi:MAG: putative porin [Leptospiraceae bacterium]|uniref:hypothetical protein n=1 Tax=Flavobacterium sp. TaxID=239 RepID=UPI0025BB9B94|nr:hypothetical protein [Flavobacterium sp.]MBE7411522.1 hypothetical protein [Leptospiraceae bacterium]MCK6381336.1 putative porin [Leptospiraceae bacterium]MCK6609332.1 putative porin [Flavobacterium sp.]
MKIKIIYLILLFSAQIELVSEESRDWNFERPSGSDKFEIRNCNTAGAYSDFLTRITFYGDSRLDYADDPMTGGKNLLWYINNGIDGSDSYNLPNFGIQNNLWARKI